MPTVKQVFKLLGTEAFDVKGYEVVIELADGTRVETEDIYLDEVEHQAVLPVRNTETDGD